MYICKQPYPFFGNKVRFTLVKTNFLNSYSIGHLLLSSCWIWNKFSNLSELQHPYLQSEDNNLSLKELVWGLNEWTNLKHLAHSCSVSLNHSLYVEIRRLRKRTTEGTKKKMMVPEFSTGLLDFEALLSITMWLIFRLEKDLNLSLQKNRSCTFLTVQMLN